ncbi:two-component regulator propeller domain-containing protein [Fulvivirgaceae bacterium BMA10]|uniref:histidine kinase n=1 Tax=Splendidivirga corallicola TaxID=3051826 RepID=A0ABT8KKY6_9BACT|nr:two-component regulator propeller domain-containing protein [Fulvivirgaceae bacterium BMA10]
MRIIVLALLLTSTINNFAQTPFLKTQSLAQDFGVKQIKKIYQDGHGFIWVGTASGLFKFDGITYQQYLLPDSLVDNIVTAIFMDNQNKLWVGYKNGRLATLEEFGLKIFDPEEGTPVVAITGITQLQNGTICFSTYGEGVYYYMNDRLYNANSDDGVINDDIYVMMKDSQDQLWLGTDGGISVLNLSEGTKKIENITTNGGLPDNIVCDLTLDDRDNIWIGMYDGGICQYDISKKEFFELPIMKSWEFGTVNSLEFLGNNTIWVGTEGNGIVSVDYSNQGSFKKFDAEGGFGNFKIHDLQKDSEGNIWISSSNAGLQLANSKIALIDIPGSGDSKSIKAIASSHNENLWFSNDKGLFYFEIDPGGNQKISRHLKGEKYRNLSIISLYEDIQQTLWIGTFGQGIFRYHPNSGKVEAFSQKADLGDTNVLSIAGKGNQLWFATLGGVIRCELSTDPENPNEQVQFIKYEKADGLGSNYVYHILIDSKDRVWFATDGNGITCWEKGRFINYAEGQGLKNGKVYSVVEDPSGNIWFSTSTAGIYKFDGKNFKNFSTKQGLSDLSINGLTTDTSGKIIILTSSNLEIFDEVNQVFNRFDDRYGVNDIKPQFNAVAKSERGTIWIGTEKELIKYTPVQENVSESPAIYLDEIMVFMEGVDMLNNQVFNHNRNHLSFNYTGFWYQNPDKVEFQHKLGGLNDNWINTRDHMAVYSGLQPGKYIFNVRAGLNNSFNNSEIATFSFEIKQPFWKTPLFYIICTVFSAFIIYAFIKIRERRLNREKYILEEKIKIRTSEIEEQKIEIEAQRDKIENNLAELELALKEIKEQKEEIESQNHKLEEAQEIISVQNETLIEYNHHLEDIVEKRTKELRSAYSELLQTNEDLDHFIYRSSHDLKGPIARLLGLCELVKIDEEKRNVQTYFRLFEESAQDMNLMISHIKRAHEINRRDTRLENVPLAPVIDKICYDCSKEFTKAPTPQIDVNKDFLLYCDPELVNILFSNIIHNAYKFSKPNRKDAFVKITASKADKKHLQISVVDNGEGIDPEFSEKVFDMFFKGTENGNGYGLGLYEARIIAKKLAGKISLKIKKNTTEFVIVLPFVTAIEDKEEVLI